MLTGNFSRRVFTVAMFMSLSAMLFSIRADATETVCITGHKLYDKNTNAFKDPGEPFIPCWRIELYKGDTLQQVTFTDVNGQFRFTVPANSGLHCVKEVLPSDCDWLNTSPLTQVVDVCDVDIDLPCFTNVCVGAGGGRTPGFWSNKNGKALMTAMPGGLAGTLAFLRGLNLRDAQGNNFDPTTYTQFRTWLLDSNAVNMAFKLSSQFVAMQLNTRAGLVKLNAIVYAPGTLSANSFGFASIVGLINEANNELLNFGYTPAGHDRRQYQENLKNALDNANNNLNFVQPGPCTFTSPY